MPPLTFDIQHRDADPGSAARVGRVTTLHGSFETPAFMPVGTQGAVKGLLPGLVRATGAQCLLANTYHLMLRPGWQLVAEMGGLQRWTGWGGPMLTDSGGFQVFSLADLGKIDDDGVRFRSHLDGAEVHLTPERSIQVQHGLGADIIMAFDDCPPASAEHQLVSSGMGTANRRAVEAGDYAARNRLAAERTQRWLERCATYHHDAGAVERQSLFGIVQGGTDLELRRWCAERVTGLDLPGYAIGGVAVGEGHEELKRVVGHTAPLLPAGRPRYLMGVGYERDLLAAVRAGVDMFDCVLPTRNGRTGSAFTRTGQIRLKNARFKDDPRPIDSACDCVACGGSGSPDGADSGAPNPKPHTPDPATVFSRSYLRHLLLAGEMLGPILISLHNLRHFQRLMLDIRQAIQHNDWSLLADRWPVTTRDPPAAVEEN